MSVRGQGVAAAIAAAQQAVAAGSLILPDPYTVDTLPDPSGCPDMYATVTDLFGVKRDKVLACKVGASWYWQPVRPDHTATQAANASPTLTCLKSPSFLVLTGTLTASRTITLSTAYAYPGAAFDIAMAGTLGLFGLTIAGLSLGATLSLLANGRRRVFFDGTAWQSYA